jgi:hypothetical protein
MCGAVVLYWHNMVWNLEQHNPQVCATENPGGILQLLCKVAKIFVFSQKITMHSVPQCFHIPPASDPQTVSSVGTPIGYFISLWAIISYILQHRSRSMRSLQWHSTHIVHIVVYRAIRR